MASNVAAELCVIVGLLSLFRFSGALQILATFMGYNSSGQFNHMTVDKSTGQIYVAAVNWLYQLNNDLDTIVTVQTGPQLDSAYCYLDSCHPGAEKTLTDHVNKALLIDWTAETLIACGSLFQGLCERYELGNITKKKPTIRIPVAANDATSSTFAFIAPGVPDPTTTSVLYVGTTNTGYGPYRKSNIIPAVSSRSLSDDRTFKVIEEGDYFNAGKAEVKISDQNFIVVSYKFGFYSQGFSYFVTVQRSSVTNKDEGYLSKILRVCDSDPKYNSYVEITLKCLGADKSNYSLVQALTVAKPGSDLAHSLGITVDDEILIGVFSKSDGITNATIPKSAVCIYALEDIKANFEENIQACIVKEESVNLGHIAGYIGCFKGQPLDYCRSLLKIGGKMPISAQAAITFERENLTLTAVAAVTVQQHTVAFIGTDRGEIKKILLRNGTYAKEVSSMMVHPNSSISSDLIFDSKKEHLYIMTADKVSKLKIEECETYKNCSECLSARDPYCGWCSLQKRCTVKSACLQPYEEKGGPPKWLPFDADQCLEFVSVTPDHLPIFQRATVHLEIPLLPKSLEHTYSCVFGSAPPSPARLTRNGLSCDTPSQNYIPPIAKGRDNVEVPLSVRSNETNTDFVSRRFSFFDCNIHHRCKSCVNSRWGCHWCLYDNRCAHDPSNCHMTVIHGSGSGISSNSRSPELDQSLRSAFCPRFNISKEILLPNDVTKPISVEVLHLPSPLADQRGFECLLEVEGVDTRISAIVVNGKTVLCDSHAYFYLANEGEIEGNLSVLWNRNHFIDSTKVILYKCNIKGPDCSLCLTRDLKYRCAWLANFCQFTNANNSVMHMGHCPAPTIHEVYPLNGPVEGGTLVTIVGSNMGRTIHDVANSVFVAEIPCQPVEYEISVRIVCRTQGSGRELSGNVSVRIGSQASYSLSRFYYWDPWVSNMYPSLGPQSGGTKLTISGRSLNIGGIIKAYLDNLPCLAVIDTTQSNSAICWTTPAPTASYMTKKFTISFDGANRTLTQSFQYVEDPQILSIVPQSSFVSGGRNITVTGTNLFAILEPKMFIHKEGIKINETICKVWSGTVIHCPSPVYSSAVFPQSDRHRRDITALELQIGFEMDAVESVRNISGKVFKYFVDPKFAPFSEGDKVKLYKGDPLIIEGESLNLACKERDVNVSIGNQPCNVTSLAATQLVCTPPLMQPGGVDDVGRETNMRLPLVVVKVGDLRAEIGYLKYEVRKPYKFPPVAIGGIAAGGGFLILLSIVILIVYRRKSTQAEREYKRIQIQMDTLESNVRSECKQAFAELQTDMTDLTSDLEASGIPFLDRRTYIIKVFFPGIKDHLILQDSKSQANRKLGGGDLAMSHFEQLINNKVFLLTFIETLESQKSFGIRDKVNVASLLMVILMGNMEYATDILKSLLSRLIDKSVDTKHPQLMLRRTESMVEKLLTNWMALCLYNYLKDYAGASLFLLLKAIKHQVEKGPVDFVTHDARYSLSEDRLLREKVDYTVVTIHLAQEDLDEKVQCRVLDCDTISQVKSKLLDALHKNTPMSIRPSIHDVDLEWRHGRGGHLTLQDEDVTSEVVDGWKRLNTLKHYGVKESAIMTLITRQNESFNSTGVSVNSITPMFQLDLEQGVKLWHLDGLAYRCTTYGPQGTCGPQSTFLRPAKVKPIDEQQQQQRERCHKSIPEIFLTRLLSTKGTIQKFVDDFFQTILMANQMLPPAIKYLFDFLDDAARRHYIADPEVVHAWKNNSLPLRFWVNFIKNPDFVFDVDKSPILDSCLSVIAQTFMDSCSTSEHRLGKDSPTNKLLFAKDIPHYKEMVTKFYSDIQEIPAVSDQEMNAAMAGLSREHRDLFDTVAALKELYSYATKYYEQILVALDTDPTAKKKELAHKLENVSVMIMDGDSLL